MGIVVFDSKKELTIVAVTEMILSRLHVGPFCLPRLKEIVASVATGK
jgi:hypothetical protein